MNDIHQELNKKFNWYKKWHDNPGHHFAHWLIFILFIFSINAHIVDNVASLSLAAPDFPPTSSSSTNLGEIIGMIFSYSLQILGLIVFLMILFSGFQWLTAGGNPGIIGTARTRITNALLGGLVLLAAYLILNTINPDLVNGGFRLEGINVKEGL